jgi:hypothetical protein
MGIAIEDLRIQENAMSAYSFPNDSSFNTVVVQLLSMNADAQNETLASDEGI